LKVLLNVPGPVSPPTAVFKPPVYTIQNEECDLESSEGSEDLDEIESLNPAKKQQSITPTNSMSTRSFRSQRTMLNNSVNRFARKEARIVSELNSDINYALNFSNDISRRGSFGKSVAALSQIGT
jgi:hypothetical protein